MKKEISSGEGASNGDQLPSLRALPGSGDLPEAFVIEVDDLSLHRLDVEAYRRMKEGWKNTKEELQRRGYQVTEWIDHGQCKHVATCRRILQNVELRDGGTTTENKD